MVSVRVSHVSTNREREHQEIQRLASDAPRHILSANASQLLRCAPGAPDTRRMLERLLCRICKLTGGTLQPTWLALPLCSVALLPVPWDGSPSDHFRSSPCTLPNKRRRLFVIQHMGGWPDGLGDMCGFLMSNYILSSPLPSHAWPFRSLVLSPAAPFLDCSPALSPVRVVGGLKFQRQHPVCHKHTPYSGGKSQVSFVRTMQMEITWRSRLLPSPAIC